MIKVFGLLKRKSGTTMEQFIEYYETHHAPLSVDLVPNLKKYVRHYIRPIDREEELPYDVVTEICFADQEDFERGFAYLSEPAAAAAIAEDAERFCDWAGFRSVIVDDRESDLSAR